MSPAEDIFDQLHEELLSKIKEAETVEEYLFVLANLTATNQILLGQIHAALTGIGKILLAQEEGLDLRTLDDD